jgi:hypothetical protein
VRHLRPTLTRRARILIAFAAAALLSAGSASLVSATPAFPTHTCGHFFHKGHDVIVYNGATPTCSTATAIIKAFWSGKGVTMHGTSDATGYFSIAAWPGYRCYQAMGAGDCVKHDAIAGYRVKGF